MRNHAERPHPRRIDARNHDLARGELEQLGASPRMRRRREAFGAKDDWLARFIQRARNRKIVAHGAAPKLKHLGVIKRLASNSRATAPAEVVLFLSEHRGDGCVPRRRHGARKSALPDAAAWND